MQFPIVYFPKPRDVMLQAFILISFNVIIDIVEFYNFCS